MGWFSSDKNEEKVVDTVSRSMFGIGEFIDEAFHTDEEKSVASAKAFDQYLLWIGATQGMNKARRWMAMMFAVNFIVTFQLCLWIGFYAWVTGKDVGAFLDWVVELVGVFQLGWIMVTIVVFYYGKRIVSEGVATFKGK